MKKKYTTEDLVNGHVQLLYNGDIEKFKSIMREVDIFGYNPQGIKGIYYNFDAYKHLHVGSTPSILPVVTEKDITCLHKKKIDHVEISFFIIVAVVLVSWFILMNS